MDKDAEASFKNDADNEAFWSLCDDQLIFSHGNKAKYWLGMLEDPDPDDLIFEYQKIIRHTAYVQGYYQALRANGIEPWNERTEDAKN